MNDIDDKIRQALNEEDRKVLDHFGADPGPISMAMQTFKGNQRWFAAGIWLFGMVVFVLLIICSLNFFAADDLDARMTWAVGLLLCGNGLVIVKIGAWQQMQSQLLLREIKRLELRWLAAMEK